MRRVRPSISARSSYAERAIDDRLGRIRLREPARRLDIARRRAESPSKADDSLRQRLPVIWDCSRSSAAPAAATTSAFFRW